jgi:predicted Zn-dependent protease
MTEQGPLQPERRGSEPQPALPSDEPLEAHGFGNRPWRMRLEFAVLVALLVGLPLAVIWGARAAAASLALRLPPSMDERLGRPTWEALRASPEHCRDRMAERYVEQVAAPLVAALGATAFQFRFIVVDSDSVNAFALPGGYVVVNSGLLARAENGDEVAAVLAHELSHVTLRHSTQRLAGTLGTSAALSLLLGGVDLGAPAYTLAHLAGLGYERAQESAADESGRALLMRAGISPLGMASFFSRLADTASPPELLSTHPDPGDRAARAREQAKGFEARLTLPPPPAFKCQ